MKHTDYPGLYTAADAAAINAQSAHLSSFKWHIIALLLGAVLAINPVPTTTYSLINAVVFLAALGISIFIATKRLDKSWYSARAVAESVKTAAWRYMMRAEPFRDAGNLKDVNDDFRELLENILSSNNQLGEIFKNENCARDQISEFMRATRAETIEKRRALYLASRIQEQRVWYSEKAKHNQKRSSQFFILLFVLQAIAVALVLTRIVFPAWEIWPTELFVVAAGSVTAWVQLKRYQDIGTAYALTAHEIGIIESRFNEPDTDAHFPQLVRDTENAFSREHTQWVAKSDR